MCVNDALVYFVHFCKYTMSPKGLDLTQIKVNPCVFFECLVKIKVKIIVICYVGDCCIMCKPEHVNEMKNKFREEFVIIKYCQLSKLLGVQYNWEIFESGEIYVVMSMSDKA